MPSTTSTFSLRSLVALLLAVFVPALLPATAAHAQDPVQWTEPSGGNGHWYQRVTTPGEIGWSEAQAVATALGGQLVTIESAAEQAWILANLVNPADACPSGSGGPDRAIWIGLRQDAGATEPGGGWRWVTGGLAAELYENWFTGRPDNLPAGADVAGMSADGTWDDLTNDAGDDCFHSYVIEWSADCDGNGIVDFGEMSSGGADTDLDRIHDACERAYGDVDLDGDVDALDLSVVLAAWGTCTATPCEADLNGDREVDALDLAILLAAWGTTPAWESPTIAAVSPGIGSVGGGTVITITGTKLAGTTSVTVGGVPATSLAVLGPTTVTAVTPPGATGEKTVSLSTAVGTATLPGGFAYLGVPTIDSVSPSEGPIDGGTPITISGTNLSGTTSVLLGGVPASSVVVVDDTRVTAVTPGGPEGLATASLNTPAGTGTLPNGFRFFIPAPTITSVSPDGGPVIGGTPITITGTNLAGTTAVSIGGVAASSFTVVGPTSVIAVTPAGTAGPKAVSVTAPGGVASLPGAYTYFGVPTVASVSPSIGTTAGGTPITITGANLAGVTSVMIGGTAATSVVVVSPTTLTAVTPPGTPGTKLLTLTTPGGTSSVAGGYSYLAAPTATSTFPSVGPVAGGTPFTVVGTNFYNGITSATVTVDGVPATSVSVIGTTAITAVTPPGTAGAKTIVVTTPSGTATLSGGFSFFEAPSITSISPDFGPTVGGTAITITGTNLAGTTGVTVGGVVATSVAVVNPTTVTAVVPAGTVGPKTVTLTNPGGTTNFANGFTYVAVPSIASVTPGAGLASGGTLITINGTNLTGTTAVTVGGVPATSVTVVSPSIVTAVTPPGPIGPTVVWLSTPGGWTSLADGFTYVAAPTIASISPNSGPTGGGTVVTISGTSFVAGAGSTTVTIGGNTANVTFQNAFSVTAVAPATTSPGPKTVTLATPFGSASVPNGFTYIGAPTITSVSPGVGPAGGGTPITITGTDLFGTTSVTVGGNSATFVTVVNATTVTAVTPPGTAGPKQVSVTTSGGTANLANGFTYVAAPTITAVTPNSGPIAGGTPVTITGQNLGGATEVTFGGNPATSFVQVNATSISAVTPAGAPGPATVSVTTPGGTVDFANGFTYTNTNWFTVLEQVPDPAVVTNAGLRTAITNTGRPWRVRDRNTGIEMVLIPGTAAPNAPVFSMGCTAGQQGGNCPPGSSPAFNVTFTYGNPNAIYVSRHEVTQEQWTEIMGSNPSSFQGPNYPDSDNRPVEQVSWNDVQGFLTQTGFRLLTEAEWEYACRAGTNTAYYNGNAATAAALGAIAWFSDNNGTVGTPTYGTKVVGQKAQNGFGLFDISGNVWEWVSDWYGPYPMTAQTNPQGPAAGVQRVLRGGGFSTTAVGVRSSYRNLHEPTYSSISIGFRVARSP